MFPVLWGVLSLEDIKHLSSDQLQLAIRVAQKHEKRVFDLIKAAVNGGIYESFKGGSK
ncbi:hypothetical protein LbDm2_2408 [Levilactobacillus brevis]|nr:hypothetical protein LbDm2_2408 [Levilactobacillus brevis]